MTAKRRYLRNAVCLYCMDTVTNIQYLEFGISALPLSMLIESYIAIPFVLDKKVH